MGPAPLLQDMMLDVKNKHLQKRLETVMLAVHLCAGRKKDELVSQHKVVHSPAFKLP